MDKKTTLDKINRAATNEFAQYGFDGARMDRIAQKGKINKAMIYYHFKSKEVLYEHILNTLYERIFHRITSVVPHKENPAEQVQAMIDALIDFIIGEDENFVRIMLREVSSGGKYFKKIAIPKLMIPVLGVVQDILEKGKEDKVFKDIHPQFSFIQIVGSIAFFNIIRITIGDTDIGKVIFSGDYAEIFKENFKNIIMNGMLQ